MVCKLRWAGDQEASVVGEREEGMPGKKTMSGRDGGFGKAQGGTVEWGAGAWGGSRWPSASWKR